MSAKTDISIFRRILKSFGFKKANETDYTHEYGIYSDILDRGNFAEVWMRGNDCQENPGFPGGRHYTEDTLKKELTKVLKK